MQLENSDLQWLCERANELAFEDFGFRNSCIQTSAAIRDVLVALTIPAELMRVRAVVLGSTPPACVLGSDGDGTRRPASGGWHGHLVVIAAERFLIDATLDQVNEGHGFSVRPLVATIGRSFLNGRGAHFDDIGASGESVVYQAFPGRGGWKSTPAFRPGQRRALVATLLSDIAELD